MLGYGIDRKKLNQLILKKAPDIDPSLVNDAADSVIGRLLDNVDNDQHWVVLGELNGDSFIIISFGQEAFGNNCEDLKQKDIHPPEYLDAWQNITCGPTVFEFRSFWPWYLHVIYLWRLDNLWIRLLLADSNYIPHLPFTWCWCTSVCPPKHRLIS